VTLDGEIVSQRGAISGGSAPEDSRGILMREARISELADEKERLSEEIDKFTSLEESVGAVLLELEREQVEIAKSLKPLREKLTGNERELIRISALKDSLDKEHQFYTTRTEKLRNDLADSDRSRGDLEKRLLQLRDERAAVEAEIEQVRSGRTGAEERRTALENELTELKVRNASLVERKNFLENTCSRLEEELERRGESVDRKISEVDSGKHHVEELRKNIEFLKETVAALEEEKISSEKAIELIDEHREESVSAVTALEEEVRRQRLSLKSLQEDESAQSIRLAELRFSISGIDERLRNEYNMTPNSPLVKRLPENTDWEEIEARIEDLRRKKESMGEVNMYAIEEQERLQERYDVLTEQQTDLIDAKESLLKVISKINTEARRLFRETFTRVREEFKTRFNSLFGGGRADLMLLDDHDVLECGIEIVASPPGKKLQSISLLSGGEKVMTAVSLLFAIFKVKPSPFCILDEVDAALDDPNIVRFTDTLQEFLSGSQFIVITHNKRTISMADVLYGITMEKSGISKVVSVRFRERDDTVRRAVQQSTE
jgi:chromosome segregation protein